MMMSMDKVRIWDKKSIQIQCCVVLTDTKLRLFVSVLLAVCIRTFVGTSFTSTTPFFPLNDSKRLDVDGDDDLLLFVLDPGDGEEDDLLLFVLISRQSSLPVTTKFIAATSLLWLTVPPMSAKRHMTKMNKLSPTKAFVIFLEE
mmetsp:Transcript_340/g.465  ORF Transcript_340/g.465 Transcript_340/m.465 type:complete len:144 (+) Transcript_340:166-597(+)